MAYKKDNINRTYSFSSPNGGSGDYYVGGFYSFSEVSQLLNETGTTYGYGASNVAYGTHAFVVCGGAGSVNSGVIGLRVKGTSITDEGVRTLTDTEVLTNDITSVSLNEYLETSKKWLGEIEYELYIVSGSPTTYDLTFNYGLVKYEDFGNKNFEIQDFEMIGRAGANDSGFNIRLIKHTSTGWTYNASDFDVYNNVLENMNDDYVVEKDLAGGKFFAYKKTNINIDVEGSNSEGIVIIITTGANNSVESSDISLGVKLSSD